MGRGTAFGPEKDPRQKLARPRTTAALVESVLRVAARHEGDPNYIRLYLDQLDAETGGLSRAQEEAIHEALLLRYGGAVAAVAFGLPTPTKDRAAAGAAIAADARAWLAQASASAVAEGGAALTEETGRERNGVAHATAAAPEWARVEIRRLTTVSAEREAEMRRQVAVLKETLRSRPTWPLELLRPFDEWTQVDGVLARSREPFVAQGWLADDPLLGTLHLDRLLDLCQAESVWVSRLADVPFHADVLEGLFYQAAEEPKQALRRILLRSRGGKGTKLSGKKVDSVATQLLAAPGYVAAGTAGALRSAPFGLLDGSAEWLEEQSVEYLVSVGVREDEAREHVAKASLIGELAADGAQALGVARGAGAAAKHADKAFEAAEKLDTLLSHAELAGELLAAWDRYRPVFDTLWKTVNDLVARASALRVEPTDAEVERALIKRAVAEALVRLAALGTKSGDAAALKRYRRTRRGVDLARYLARRCLVRGSVAAVTKVGEITIAVRGGPGPHGPELRRRLPEAILPVVTATIRSVAVDALKAATGMDDLVLEWAIDLLSKHVQLALTDDIGRVISGELGS